MHLNVFVCTLFAGSKPVKTQIRPNRTGIDPAKNQIGIGSISRWQKPDRTEPFRGVVLHIKQIQSFRLRINLFSIQQSLIHLLMFKRSLQIFVFANHLEFSNSIRESETFFQD
jgi:hypothetical protein